MVSRAQISVFGCLVHLGSEPRLPGCSPSLETPSSRLVIRIWCKKHTTNPIPFPLFQAALNVFASAFPLRPFHFA